MEKYLLMLKLTNISELSILSEGNDAMKEVKKTLEDMGSDELFTEYEREKLEEYSVLYGMSSAKKEGREEGLQEGRQEGRQEEKIEIARNLVMEGVDVSVIQKVTNLSKEEIESLKEKS